MTRLKTNHIKPFQMYHIYENMEYFIKQINTKKTRMINLRAADLKSSIITRGFHSIFNNTDSQYTFLLPN